MSVPAKYSAPGYGVAPQKEKKVEQTTYNAPTDAESAPVYSKGTLFDSLYGKIVVVGLVVVLVFMFLLAFSFCLVGAIKYKQPKYFALMVNIFLSTVVTGILIFWLYRGILASGLVWYIFAQCLFLFFQLITTDIFAWYATNDVNPATPLNPAHNCSNLTHNCTRYSRETYEVPIAF